MAHSAKPFKPGPRDIGRIHNTDWTPIDYQEKDTNSSGWLKEKLNIKSKANSNKKQKIFKPGPRQIGRIKHSKKWKPIELTKEEEMKLNSGSFLQERVIYKRKPTKTKTKTKIYKPGPIDIGKNNTWNPIPIPMKSARFCRKKRKGRKKRTVSVPNLKISFTPNTPNTPTSPVFIGYCNEPLQENTEINNNEINNNKIEMKSDSESDTEISKPQSPKFTFNNIKSKYKPHRIQWTKTCKLKSYDANNIANDTDTDTDEDNTDTDVDSDDDIVIDDKQNEKCIKINELLSELLAYDEEQLDEQSNQKTVKTPGYTVMVNDIQQNENGENVYICENENNENNLNHINEDDNDAGELLFDFTNFISHLKNKNKKSNTQTEQL